MSEIKRYEMTVLNSFAPDRYKEFGMVESEQGAWVRWEDVQKSLEFLEAQAKELVEELDYIKDRCNKWDVELEK